MTGRVQPPKVGDERSTLNGFLNLHRATLLAKCDGLTPSQLAQRSCPPSELSLLGLVRHLAEVERSWFQRWVAGLDAPFIYCADDIDGDFHVPDGDDVALAAVADQAFADWRAEVARSEQIVGAIASLDETFAQPRHGELSIRWLLLHMIEEYARHNGHADLLREAIDGTTGR